MNCEIYRDLLWEFISGEIPDDEKPDIENHLSYCASCSEKLESLKELKKFFNAPSNLDVDGAKTRILSNIYSNTPSDRGSQIPQGSTRRGFIWWAAPVALAASLLVAISFALWPKPTLALSVDDLLNQHVLCVKDGHLEKYTCLTQVELDKKILNMVGLKPHPFSMKHHNLNFVKGDVCYIRGAFTGHALFEAEDGGMVSHFHVKDENGQLLKREGLLKINDFYRRITINNHELLIMEREPGHYEVYIAEMPFDRLKDFVDTDKS